MWCFSRKEVLQVQPVSEMLMGHVVSSRVLSLELWEAAWVSVWDLSSVCVCFFLSASAHLHSADSEQDISSAGSGEMTFCFNLLLHHVV